MCRQRFHNYEDLNNHYTLEHLEKHSKQCQVRMQADRVCGKNCLSESEARFHEHEAHEALFDPHDIDTVTIMKIDGNLVINYRTEFCEIFWFEKYSAFIYFW